MFPTPIPVSEGIIPTPDYDSGWQSISQNQTKTLTHNLGGDPDNYLVELTAKEISDWDIFESFLYRENGYHPDWYGCHWRELNNSIIKVYRGDHDYHCDKIRVRIWVQG